MVDRVGYRGRSNRRKADAEVNWREIAVVAVYCVATVVAGVAFYSALTTEGTDEGPAGVAGLFAPLIALSVAAMIVAKHSALVPVFFCGCERSVSVLVVR